VGGIASVIQTILESELAQRFCFERFSTTQRRFNRRDLVSRAFNSVLARSVGFDGIVGLESRGKLRAFRAMLAKQPDLVHLHSSHGYDFWLSVLMARDARRSGVPSLLHLHGLFDVVVPYYSAIRRAVFARSLRVPDRIIVLSQGWKRWFEGWLESDRIEVVHNCVDTRRFPEPEWKRRTPGVRILFVGTSDPRRKGGYDILAIASEVVRAEPSARFVFVGTDVDELERRFVRGTPLATHFEFTGSKDSVEIVRYFTNADLLLLPSYSEGLPIALLEGMAAGLPVIATPVNGIPEAMTEPDHGLFVPSGDRPALLRAVLALVRDPERRERMGRAGRARVQVEFDRTHFASRLCQIYEGVLAERGKARGGEDRGARQGAR